MAEEGTRHFTPIEAEALLPQIDALLARAQELVARADTAGRARGAQANGRVQRNGQVTARPSGELQTIQAELQRIVQEIQAQGIIVRDIRTGLIDFPALREGEEIYLCWQRGEPLRIEWWHPTHTGIAGRQRL